MLSSAQLQTSDFVIEKNKSFMKILKRKGRRIDPCGTPVLILCLELKQELILVLCFLLLKIIEIITADFCYLCRNILIYLLATHMVCNHMA